MKRLLLILSVLTLAALAGCSKTEPSPTIDPATAKAQPGADTPAAPVNPGAAAAQRAEKEGK